MEEKKEAFNRSDIDKGLVALFLKMSPEERLKANDNAVRAILEMRRAFEYEEDSKHRS